MKKLAFIIKTYYHTGELSSINVYVGNPYSQLKAWLKVFSDDKEYQVHYGSEKIIVRIKDNNIKLYEMYLKEIEIK